MDQLDNFWTQKAELKQEDFEQNVLKCIKLLDAMLNESEKQGTSGLKSHSSLAKGDIIKIISNV